jgi:hypothetical protein
MIYTAPSIMFLMRSDPVLGQVGGGWALEIEIFLGPVKWHRADRRVLFGAQKTQDGFLMFVISVSGTVLRTTTSYSMCRYPNLWSKFGISTVEL